MQKIVRVARLFGMVEGILIQTTLFKQHLFRINLEYPTAQQRAEESIFLNTRQSIDPCGVHRIMTERPKISLRLATKLFSSTLLMNLIGAVFN